MTFSETENRTRSAVFAIILSVAALSLGDALVKAAGLALPLWQMFVLRSALVVPILWRIARRRGGMRLSNAGWALLRSVLLVLMWLSYYSALPLMPLSLAAASYYTGPLFIVALSALVAHRRPSRRAMVAVALGFGGVLLVIRPDASGVAFDMLLPVAAAFLYGCAMVLTSAKCREDDPFLLALVLNLTFIASGAMLGLAAGRDGSLVLGPWRALDLDLVLTIAGLAALFLIGSVGAAVAYQKGPPATVAAFDYSYLAFSLVWGSLFFGEWPGALSLAGMAVVVAAGLLSLTRSKTSIR